MNPETLKKLIQDDDQGLLTLEGCAYISQLDSLIKVKVLPNKEFVRKGHIPVKPYNQINNSWYWEIPERHFALIN